MLDKLYVDARYPGNLGLLPNGMPSLAMPKDSLPLLAKSIEYKDNLGEAITLLPQIFQI
ncbi:MAG: hypothetical protein AAGU11_14010 [Syntrophobacteraceae bacterium]